MHFCSRRKRAEMLSKLFHLFSFFVRYTIVVWFFFSIDVSATPPTLHIYNWSDFIARDTLANFKQQTGINITYDIYDSNEILDGKLMAGNTGFDLVVPSDNFLARQLHLGLYLPLDKQKLPNYHHLDEKLLRMMAIHDPDNRYAIPYIWQSTGIGYNVEKVKQILGDNAPLDSWDLVFKAENLTKLKQCGVAFLDTPSEMFPTVLNYLAKDPNSQNPEDYQQAMQFLATLRDNVTYFHNSKYISDLSAGDICVAIGWSGDIMQAANAAKLANNGVQINYFVPKEGAIISFDVWAIPKDAKNVDLAHIFLNYLLEPKVIANNTNTIFYPNANIDSINYLLPEIKNNPAIYPSDEVIERLFIVKEQSAKIDKIMVRLWTRLLSGQ